METIVVDSDIIVASFLENELQHNDGRRYIDGLESGDYVFHVPTLVIVEVTSAINRRGQRNRLAILTAWRQNVIDWEQDGKLVLYPLDQARMNNAENIAIMYGLRGSDSVVATLSQEMGFSLRSFDREIIARFPQASP